MSEPPEGYLGSTARIRSGPAPEMVAAGYELEVADAPLLHHGLTLADLAHTIMLTEQSVIEPDAAAVLLAALLHLADVPAAEFPFDARYGDAYNSRERWLQERVGAAAGWLAAGRPRREAGRIAFRIALRERLVDQAATLARLAGALVDAAAEHAATVMADYTYLQAAQPSTFGHYLLSFVYPTLRDGERLRAGHAGVNRSPGGAGGVAGSRLPLDRRRVAELLGFAGFVTHTRDAMWSTDGLIAVLSATTSAVTTASRLAEDLEIYGSAEFGLVRIGDDLCRASVLLPQKRNPYALPVIRGAAGTLLGRLTGVVATQRTPSARTDNLLYAYGEVCGSVELGTRALALAAAVVESLEADPQAMARSASEGFAQASDLAEAICEYTGLDYRSAYLVVGRAVTRAFDEQRRATDLTSADLAQAAIEVLGEPLEVTPAVLADATDPRAIIATRTEPGGAAAEPLAAMVAECRAQTAAGSAWAREQADAAAHAEAALLAEARRRCSGPPGH